MFNVLNIFNSLLSDNRIILCNKCYIPKSIFVGSLFDKFSGKSDIHFLLVKYYTTNMEFKTHIKIY